MADGRGIPWRVGLAFAVDEFHTTVSCPTADLGGCWPHVPLTAGSVRVEKGTEFAGFEGPERPVAYWIE